MKKCSIFLSLIMSFCLFLTGCQIEEKTEEIVSESGLYCFYLNKDATQLEKEAYKPSDEEETMRIADLMMRIGSKNSEEKTTNLLPQEVSINSYELQNTTLVIDFNSQYSKMSRTREILARAGIAKTFLQFPSIQAVRFTILSEELKDTKQQVIGDMTEDTFVEYSGTSDIDNYRYETLTLYFTDASGSGLRSEKRSVYYKPSLPKEKVVLEQLVKGPMEKENYPTISESTRVLSISTSEDTCYVSLNQSFIDSPLIISEQLPIYSIVNSLIDSCGMTRVQISIDGNAELTFGENMSLYKFYEKNEGLLLP